MSDRCARDLVKGDISCLLALEEWQDQSAQGPIETTYFIEDVLKEVQGRRRVFGKILDIYSFILCCELSATVLVLRKLGPVCYLSSLRGAR